MFRSRHICVLLVAFLAEAALVAAPLSTGDGLAVDLADTGQVTAVRIGATALPLRGAGGFLIADFNHQPEPANLVPNPGFEQGTAGWPLAASQSLDTTVVHAGRASVRLQVPGPAPAQSNLGVVVPVKPNTRYRVGLWLRREGVGVCGAYSSERDDANRLTGKVTQTGPGVPREDGVWHPLAWELTTQPATTRLSLRADIYQSTGTLWVDDFFVQELSEGVYDAVPGHVSMTGNQAAFRGALPGRGLELEATLTADRECLRVEGEVRDLTGNDRALGVRFALPLDLAGWTWYHDAEERESIAAGPVLRRTYNCVSGIGLCSVYPWSALAGPDAGLSLALPLSQGPRVFVIQHDQGRPETALTFYVGLSKDAGRHPSRAPFTFVLYRHDPAWGMRSAMARYYRLFPESFVKRPVYEGYLNYADMERFDPATHRLVVTQKIAIEDASDFGEGYRFVWHMHGCYDYRQVPYDDPKRPDDETVFRLLGEMVEAEKARPKAYTPSAETLRKIVFGPQGGISYIGDTKYWRAHEGYNHTDEPGWGFNFRVNEDPDVSPFLADLARRRAEEYVQKNTGRRPWDATFTADAIEGYMSNSHELDFRREHFRTTLVPLTFGRDTLAPAMPNTIWDFHHKSWWPLTQEQKILTYGNANCYEQAFALPFVDIPMTEFDWDRAHPGRLDRYLRALAYHKIWRHWHAWGPGGYADTDPACVQAQFRRGLAYAVFPPVYCIPTEGADIETHRAAFRQYVPAMEELSAAGWEPVPYARATGGLVVERFGSFAAGDLHLVLRNQDAAAVETVVTLDRQALGIPPNAALCWIDILPRTPQVELFPGDGLQCRVDADGTLALWVGTRDQAAQHGFRLALATLEKTERLFQTEMGDLSRSLWSQATVTARQGTTATGAVALGLAESLQGAAGQLGNAIKTKAPVDLAKLLFRVRAEVSLVPVALTGLRVRAERVLADRPRGEAAELPVRLEMGQGGQARAPADLAATVLSPWPTVAAASGVRGLSADGFTATLQVPAEPERRLLPYLVMVSGRLNGSPCTVAVPVDLQTAAPLAVSVLPERAFRGQTRHLRVAVTSRVSATTTLTLRLAPPARVRAVPAEVPVTLPALGQAEAAIDLILDPGVPIGALHVPYTTTSQDRRFVCDGVLSLTVSDPVPQLAIRRLPAPPAIDGNLADAAWQSPPSVPELRLLANGGPASEKTAVWLAYDEHGLYVAMRCAESQMDKLVARHSERGAPLYQDDDVEIFVLPPGGAQVCQMAVNALGTRSDNLGNTTDWAAAASRGPAEWSVEAFIPYAVLGVATPPARGNVWCVQFGRQQKAKRETTSWTPGQSFIAKESLGEVTFE